MPRFCLSTRQKVGCIFFAVVNSIVGSQRHSGGSSSHYAHICRSGETLGRRLGSDIAGHIEAVGRNVKRFQVGDDVFGDLSGRWGGFAAYVCAPETALALKPPSMTFAEAAAMPQAGMLAVHGLRHVERSRPGQRLLINGAGGDVGPFAVFVWVRARSPVADANFVRPTHFLGRNCAISLCATHRS
jgi:threonine dehydrogenase-like Zn-dependent dehydrogenase